jgi:hypothetical protein
MIYTTQYYSLLNQENEMGQACGTYGRQERCMEGFGGETRKTQEDPAADGGIILNVSSRNVMGRHGLD